MMDNKTLEKMVEGMCLTLRHDFGINKREPQDTHSFADRLSSGMTDMEREAMRINMRQLIQHNVAPVIEQLEQRLATLSEELDTERVRLAACGVAALENTRESMAKRITSDNPYYSASYGDVCRAVDKQVAYREQIESQPSAEAIVAAALDAAANAVLVAAPWLPSLSEAADVIRALDHQKIIDEVSK